MRLISIRGILYPVLLFFFHLPAGFTQICDLEVCNRAQCGSVFVSFSPIGNNVFCEGDSIRLQNTSSTRDFEEFYIDWGDGTIDTILGYSDVTHTYDYSGIDRCTEGPEFNQVFCYIGKKTCPQGISCNWATGVLTVKLRPVADFQPVTQVCMDNTVHFQNTSCNGETYHWSFGDGNTSTAENPSHVYSMQGFYTVSLVVTNSCGSDTIRQVVEVVGYPEADFSYAFDPQNGCAPLTVSFTNTSNDWSTTRWSITPADTTRWMFTDTSMTLQTRDIEVLFEEPGTYVVTLTASNICGQDILRDTIEVYEIPFIELVGPLPSCDSIIVTPATLEFQYGGTITDFSWTFVNGSIPSASGPTFPPVVFWQSGSIILTISSPCGDLADTLTVQVANSAPISFDGNPSSVCQNQDEVQMLATPPGGTWSMTGAGGDALTDDGVLDPALLSPGTYELEYSAGTNDCPNADTLMITILQAPGVTLAPVAAACDSMIYIPQVTYQGDLHSYTWTFAGGSPSTSQSADPGEIVFGSSGGHQVIITVSGVCGMVSDTTEIEVVSSTVLSIEPVSDPLCAGSAPYDLEVNIPGGIWSGPGISDPAEGIFDPAAVAPDQTYTIRYTWQDGPCTNVASTEISVVSSQSAFVTDIILCIDSDPVVLQVDVPGGAWSGTGITDPVTGIFDPAVSGIGDFVVGYSFEDPNGCQVTVSGQVLVEPLPLLELLDTVLICLSDTDILLEELLDFVPAPTGGQTVWTGPGVQDPSGRFNAADAGLQVGYHTVYLSYRRHDCTVADSAVIHIVPAPELELLPGDTVVCISSVSLQLAAMPAGGTWSGPGVDPVTGLVGLEAAGGGVFQYNYSYQSGTSCALQGTLQIEILDLGEIVSAGPAEHLCEGPLTYAFNGGAPTGGMWEGPGLLDAGLGLVDLAQLETDSVYTFLYCIESMAVSGCRACATKQFIIYANPSAAFDIDGLACIGSVFDLDNQSLGATRYHWDLGDGTTSMQTHISHSYTTPGYYTIRLIAESQQGCRDTAEQVRYVTTIPTAIFTLAGDEGCAPFLLELDNQSSGDDITQQWIIAGDTIPGADPGTILLDSVMSDSVFVITLEVTNLCGTVRHQEEVLVHPYPAVEFGISDLSGCSPLEVAFSNTTAGNPGYFLWDMGNGAVYTDSVPPVQIYTATDTAISEYIVTLISGNECGTDTLQRTITVYPPDVQAFIEMDTREGCPPLSITPRSFSTPGASLSWTVWLSGGVVAVSNERNPELVLTEPGEYMIVLQAANCGSDSDTAFVTVLPAPEILLSHEHLVCLGREIRFHNQTTGIGSVLWDFGDGTFSTEHSPAHTYLAPGVYTVSLSVWSSLNNCIALHESDVTVLGIPEAILAPSVLRGCPPLAVDFANGSQGFGELQYIWQFDDGSPAVFTREVNHLFEEPGTYRVSLVVYDELNCFSDTASVLITVYERPLSAFTFEDRPYCHRYDSIYLQNDSERAISYWWILDSDTIQSDVPVFLPGAYGEIDITLIVENQFQCRDSSTKTATVLVSPIAGFDLSPVVACVPSGVSFRFTGQFSDQLSWDFGDGNTSHRHSPDHLYLLPGQYEVELIATNSNGCPSDTAHSTVIVHPVPAAAFDTDRAEPCGLPAEVFLDNQSAGGRDYSWLISDGAVYTHNSPSHIFRDSGLHEVRLIVTNEFGCRDTAVHVIDIAPRPEAGFDLSASEGCEGSWIAIHNTSSMSRVYTWIIDSLPLYTDRDLSLQFSQPGLYDITLVAIYNEHCADTLTLSEAIAIYRSPAADFTYTADPDEYLVGDVQFVNRSQLADRFLWDFGDGSFSSETDPQHEYDINGDITVLLVAYNDNGGRYTCTDTISRIVRPERIATFYAPNAMAPGYSTGDAGLFKPVGLGIVDYEISVYSPWGEQVWHSTLLRDKSPAEAWDGSYRGRIVPQGAYAWVARVVFEDGSRRIEKGTVTVLR